MQPAWAWAWAAPVSTSWVMGSHQYTTTVCLGLHLNILSPLYLSLWDVPLLLIFVQLPFRHLDFFEMLRNEDELEFAKRFELVCVLIIVLCDSSDDRVCLLKCMFCVGGAGAACEQRWRSPVVLPKGPLVSVCVHSPSVGESWHCCLIQVCFPCEIGPHRHKKCHSDVWADQEEADSQWSLPALHVRSAPLSPDALWVVGLWEPWRAGTASRRFRLLDSTN